MPFARAALRPWRFTDWQLGVALLGVFLSRLANRFSSAVQAQVIAIAPVAAFVLVFAGEIIGRMLFYASYVRAGL